jgi:hypothetical protein
MQLDQTFMHLDRHSLLALEKRLAAIQRSLRAEELFASASGLDELDELLYVAGVKLSAASIWVAQSIQHA